MRLIAAVTLALLSLPATAAPPPGTDPDSETSQWYRNLKSPQGSSCCSVADCRHLPIRIVKDGYEVRVPDGEVAFKWIPVPPDKILHNIENPTGEAVVCYSPYMGIMCFIEGAGT